MNTPNSANHGFKQITLANWAEMDAAMQFQIPLTKESWVQACLSFQLKPAVPNDIAAMFEVARGSMIYGWFFYPLITLASEQFDRVLEAAARARCAQLGLPTIIPGKNGKQRDLNFSAIVESLAKAGEINQADQNRWDATRKLRNRSSHPKVQMILNPAMAIYKIEAVYALLHGLFK